MRGEDTYDVHPLDATLDIDWLLTNQCNFACPYCYPAIRASIAKARAFPTVAPDHLAAIFDGTGETCHLILSGGEPFLFPRFPEFLRLVTRRHYASIYTNLSVPLSGALGQFAEPRRIPNVFAAVHARERRRHGEGALRRYAERFVSLDVAGFNIHCIFVLHPAELPGAREQLGDLRRQGVTRIALKPFKGIERGRVYPHRMPEDEKRIVEDLRQEFASTYPMETEQAYDAGTRSFLGRECRSGRDFLKIASDGTVYRCAIERNPLGNVYVDGRLPRDASPGPCPYAHSLSLTNCLRYSAKERSGHT